MVEVVYSTDDGRNDGEEAGEFKEKGCEALFKGVRGNEGSGGRYNARGGEVSRLEGGR